MNLDAATCYRALRARDRRFDGVFFVAVRTTGIYCRPICPARPVRADRCQFFARAAEAERAGFRPCFRCRPEVAPGLGTIDSVPRLVRGAAARIEAGYLNEHSIEELADLYGVTARHLRRAMESQLGVAPVELAQTRRLAVAKQLLQDTGISLADVALASGFSSIRRFNAVFRERFGRPPSALRRQHGLGSESDCVTIRLDYRPPLDWEGLLSFIRGRAIPGVEEVAGSEYRRTVSLAGRSGWLAVTPDPDRPAIRARVSLSLAPKLTQIASRLRALFDLDARPDLISAHLSRDPFLRRWVRGRPGLRVPGAFDPFELAVRAVLGQQVSVRGATTLSGRLVQRFGGFPAPESLAAASIGDVRSIGMPEARARTLIGLAAAVAEKRLDISEASDPDRAIAEIQRIAGIGPWTAHYVAMRALHWPNAFPASDLGVLKALGAKGPKDAERAAEAWQPWRAYAAMYLWSSLSSGG